MITSEITTIRTGVYPERPLAAARSCRRTLCGRHAECAALDRLIDVARRGHGGALVVRGESGVGKSALLDYAAERASGCRVVRARGVEAEAGLGFASVQQLFGRGALERADRLPAPQRDALRGAFGLGQTSAPDWFLIGLAVVNLLSEMGAQRPVVCLVDDLQWVDPESSRVFAFLARRVAGERIAVVFTAREPSRDLDLDGLPGLTVGGLGHHDARRLLATMIPGRLDEQVRDRIVAEARGNPLALLELARGLTPAELAGGFGLPDATTRSPSQLEHDFERRVRALPDDTRRLLLIAAADAVGDVTVVMRAAEHLGIGVETVASAESDGLVEFGARVQFRHPLVRSATYRSASSDDRRRAHAALALASDPVASSDRQAWHRAHAASGPEESAAADLERSVSRARARAGTAAAAAFLERAAELTPDSARRGTRTLAAASAKFEAGDVDTAENLLAVAGLYPLSEAGAARLQRLQAQIASARGSATPALLSAAARQLESRDPLLARETHLEALWAVARTGRFGTAPASVEGAEAALASADPRSARSIDRLLEAMAIRFRRGYAAAVPATRAAVAAFHREVNRDGFQDDEVRWCWLACQFALEICDETAFVEIIRGPGQAARMRGELSILPLALNQFALHRLFVGDLVGAGRRTDEAAQITAATRNPSSIPDLSVLVAAWRGDREATMALRTRIIDETSARADTGSVQVAEYATAVLQNGFGEYDDAAASAARAHELDVFGFAPLVLPELIEAAVRSGDRSGAELALESLTERTRHCATDWARGIEARSLALLNDGPAAEELYLRALDHFGRSDITVNHARATLLYGEWLRRENRRVDARVQLRAALEAFETMGAEAFADRARRELLATGETVRKRGDETRDELTPQEAHIARLAAEGRTNPEIAAQLYLSPRTVEWHLRKVFTKLDVKGRRQLSDTILDRAVLVGADR